MPLVRGPQVLRPLPSHSSTLIWETAVLYLKAPGGGTPLRATDDRPFVTDCRRSQKQQRVAEVKGSQRIGTESPAQTAD